MKTSYVVIGIVILAIAIGGVFLFQLSSKSQTPSLGEEENMVPPLGEQSQLSLDVVYNSEGYSPKELKIKKGEIVTFKNESSGGMWPASAFHPTHTAYPGSGILKCDTPEEGTIFDACRAVEPGKEWQFQFNEIGSWKYHDHLVPTRTGTVIVE